MLAKAVVVEIVVVGVLVVETVSNTLLKVEVEIAETADDCQPVLIVDDKAFNSVIFFDIQSL